MTDGLSLKFEPQDWILPELAEFFAAPETASGIMAYLAALGLEDDEGEKVIDCVRQVVRGELPAEKMATGLVKRGFDFETALETQGLVYANFFANFEDALAQQRQLWLDLHPKEAVGPNPVERDLALEIADQCIAKSGQKFADESANNRLRNIAAAFLKEVRDEAETAVMFEKPTKTGGMAMPADQYMPLLLMLKEAKPSLGKKLEELEAEKKAWAGRFEKAKQAKVAREARLASEAAPVAAPLIREVVEKKDEAVEAPKPKPAPIVASQPQPTPAPIPSEPPPIKSAVSEHVGSADSALKSAGLTLNEEDLRRYHNATDLFFRDLRDSIETKSKFTMPSVSGGLGLTDEQADKLMAGLVRLAADERAALKEKVVEDKRQFVSQNVEKMMTEETRKESEESQSLDRMYGQIAAKASVSPKKAAPAEAPAKPSAQPAPKFIPVVSLDEKKKVAASTPPGPKVENSQFPSTAPPPPDLPTPKTQAPAVSAATRPPLPGAVIAPKPLEPKPTTADVKFAPKLTGPIEELKSMAVKDFRRLSRDPHEATLKIKDKIDLLAEQSFEAKIAGVKAWQESDTNRMYLDMLRKSLEGKPILEIITEREASNEPVLTKAEFDAIMELNRKLRFG
jgi:hypothetical protein